MAKKQPPKRSKAKPKHKDHSPHISFTRINYLLMAVGAVVLVIGYLMMGGGNQGGSEFNPEEVYSTARITIAPILVVLGFAIEVVAIFYRPKSENTEASEEA